MLVLGSFPRRRASFPIRQGQRQLWDFPHRPNGYRPFCTTPLWHERCIIGSWLVPRSYTTDVL
jgi:hypothetical protein